jgi:hypothetical protein
MSRGPAGNTWDAGWVVEYAIRELGKAFPDSDLKPLG